MKVENMALREIEPGILQILEFDDEGDVLTHLADLRNDDTGKGVLVLDGSFSNQGDGWRVGANGHVLVMAPEGEINPA